MVFTLQELAQEAGGELIGNPALTISGAASLAEATFGEISFFRDIRNTCRNCARRAPRRFSCLRISARTIAPAQIRVANPAKAFEQVVLRLAPEPIQFSPGIHATAVIAA